MWGTLQRWAGMPSYQDTLDRRQAELLQLVELGLLVTALLGMPILFFVPMPTLGRLIIALLLGVMSLASLGALWMLRSGRAESSETLLACALVVVLCTMLYGNTLANSAVPMFCLALPISLGGLLAGRRGLSLALGLSIVGVALALTLERLGAPGVGFAAATGDATAGVIISFALVAGLLAMLIDSMRSLVVDALNARRNRERELESLSHRLEAAVYERTADLEMALANLELRAADQQRLLADNQRQHVLIRELSVPVLPLSASTVVMPLVGGLDADRIAMVQARALEAIERLAARRLLLDITGVPLVDTHVAQGLIQTLTAARLLGAEVVLVGVRPEVAQAVVGLGVDLQAMRSYADLQTALGEIGLDLPHRRATPGRRTQLQD